MHPDGCTFIFKVNAMGFCGILNLIYHVALEVSKCTPLKLRFIEALSSGNKTEIIIIMYSVHGVTNSRTQLSD